MREKNERLIRFRLNLNIPQHKQINDWLNSQKEINATIIQVLDYVRINGLENLQNQDSLKIEKMKADIEYKKTVTQYTKKKIDYMNIFDSKPSYAANQAMRQNANGNTQPRAITNTIKKNFFINKIDNEFVGVCKVCQNFTTDVCTTSNEAEGDIELHLEAVHKRSLYE